MSCILSFVLNRGKKIEVVLLNTVGVQTLSGPPIPKISVKYPHGDCTYHGSGSSHHIGFCCTLCGSLNRFSYQAGVFFVEPKSPIFCRTFYSWSLSMTPLVEHFTGEHARNLELFLHLTLCVTWLSLQLPCLIMGLAQSESGLWL